MFISNLATNQYRFLSSSSSRRQWTALYLRLCEVCRNTGPNALILDDLPQSIRVERSRRDDILIALGRKNHTKFVLLTRAKEKNSNLSHMMQHILIFILHTISDRAKLATDHKWYERRSVVLQRLQAADSPKKVRTSVCRVATVTTTAKPFY